MEKHTSTFDALEQLGIGASFTPTLANMLERADMFREMSRQEVEIIAGYTQAYAAPKASIVLREGSKESCMFIISEGRIDIFKNNADNRSDKKLATVRTGKSIGEMSLIDGMPHSATAVVSETAKLLLITHNNFEKLISEHPDLALILTRKIATLMSLRLRQTSGILIDYLKG